MVAEKANGHQLTLAAIRWAPARSGFAWAVRDAEAFNGVRLPGGREP